MHQVFFTTSLKREIDPPSFHHLLADGQLLNFVADALSLKKHSRHSLSATDCAVMWQIQEFNYHS